MAFTRAVSVELENKSSNEDGSRKNEKTGIGNCKYAFFFLRTFLNGEKRNGQHLEINVRSRKKLNGKINGIFLS